MRKNLLKCLKIGLPLVTAAFVPTIVTSCSGAATTSAKTLDNVTWTTNNAAVKYSNLPSSNVSIESAAYGSNFNDGNYVLIWGSLGTDDGTTTSALATFLYGGTQVEEQDFKNTSTSFLTQFFGNSGLGNGNQFGFSVSLLMYIDIPPYDGDASSINSKEGYDSPNSKYTIDNVLNEANNGSSVGAYSQATLPVQYQLKVGTYKRTDQQAITYREFVDYLQKIRPGISSPQNGGMLAFKKGKDPQAITTLDDAATVVGTLQTYYTPTAND